MGAVNQYKGINGVGEVWVHLLEGVKGPALVLFLFYLNVSGMRPRSRLSFQPLKIPAPWVLLRDRWPIPLVPPWVTVSRFLARNTKADLKPTTFS